MARPPDPNTDVVVVGAKAHPVRDAYHLLLSMSWPAALGVIASAFLLLNFLFALGYLACGGVEGATDHSLKDAFFFSVQTMGTIGYGAMYPASTTAHVLVVGESVVSLILTALATGIVFARFSQATSAIQFSSKIAIGPMDGVPTLMFRVGNDRANGIVEATIRVVCIRTETTKEGMRFYRMSDLTLTRERSPLLSRSWTVMHRITEDSPLYGATPESCIVDEVEIAAGVIGTDDTSLQPVHGRARYLSDDIVWGARLADILTDLPDGRLQLDVRRFDDLVPTQRTEAFPYPSSAT